MLVDVGEWVMVMSKDPDGEVGWWRGTVAAVSEHAIRLTDVEMQVVESLELIPSKSDQVFLWSAINRLSIYPRD